MTTTADIADFALDLDFEDLSDDTVDELKKRIVDSLGIAIAAMDEETVGVVGETVAEFGGEGCTLWGGAGSSGATTASPPDATMYNTTLVRYLDYMDSFLAPGETPHPSDNIAGILACGEYADASGEELLTAVGVAYEVQGALAWAAPVRDRGWDSAVEGIIELAEREEIDPESVARIHLDTFAGAKLIIGGGEGSRYEVETKAQADHSLPYMLAVSLIDREMGNDQYDPERIQREDVQDLLRTVEVDEDPELTERFESGEMPAHVTVETNDGTVYRIEKDGYHVHDNSWSANLEKPHHAESRDLVVEQARQAVEHTAEGNHVNLVTHGDHGHPETYLYDALSEGFGGRLSGKDLSWEYVEQCGCGGHVTRVYVE